MNTRRATRFMLFIQTLLAWTRIISRTNVVEHVWLKTLHPAGLLAAICTFFCTLQDVDQLVSLSIIESVLASFHKGLDETW